MSDYTGGIQAPKYNAPQTASNAISLGTGAMYGLGAMSGGTAFLITGLAQLASGILGAFTSRPPRREITFEEKRWNELVGAYANLAARVDTARSVMVALNPGTKIEDYSGSSNTVMMLKT
jgi:hypothetical protein